MIPYIRVPYMKEEYHLYLIKTKLFQPFIIQIYELDQGTLGSHISPSSHSLAAPQ